MLRYFQWSNPIHNSITLNIAGLATILSTHDADLAARLRKRYCGFLVDTASAQFTIHITIKEGAEYIEPQPGLWDIRTNYDDPILNYMSYWEKGSVDMNAGIGQLEIAPQASIENFLRVLYAWRCIWQNSLLLHASGLIRGGKGYVFFGHSGSGKTTVTELSENSSIILSDDLIIIRCGDENCTLHGVPFRGAYGEAPRANQQAPIQGIFRLWQDSQHKITPMPSTIAAAELASSAPFVNNYKDAAPQLMAVCAKIVNQTLMAGLHFKREPEFWNTIDEYFTKNP